MFQPRVTLVHPTGNPCAHHAALALSEAALLHAVVTTVAHDPAGRLAQAIKILPSIIQQPVNRELQRRAWLDGIATAVYRHPWREICRLGVIKSGLSAPLGFGALGPIDWVYTALDRHVAEHHLQSIDAVYAYEDGAATTFAQAKMQQTLCLYDLPIMFHRMARELQTEEAERFPELASALQAAHEPTWKLERKEQELQLADHIFVASSVTQRSLLQADVAPQKISVIPYGAPVDYFQPCPNHAPHFRALFVGRVGPRKGVHYLLQAWQALKLPAAELQIVGVNEFPAGWLAGYEGQISYVPSVPHATLGDYYNAANVFVFPSLVEGFGLVLLEAMACGVPVITTPNTAGPDIITDGVEGFIVPIRDIESLQEKLEWCYQHPQELAEMGRAARRKAETLTWDLYRQRLAGRVQALLGQEKSEE